MKTVGIVGGLGPEATAKFYLKLIEDFREVDKTHRPPIMIFNVPMSYKLEQDIIENEINVKKCLSLLIDGIQRLNASVDFIVIPCNTVHLLINRLRNISPVPILSIIEETVRRIKSKNLRTVGILATSNTIKKKLFERKVNKEGVRTVIPSSDDQKKVSRIICDTIFGNKTDRNKKELLRIIRKLEGDGAEAIILGCTELPLIIKQEDVSIELLNTIEILSEATVNELLR